MSYLSAKEFKALFPKAKVKYPDLTPAHILIKFLRYFGFIFDSATAIDISQLLSRPKIPIAIKDFNEKIFYKGESCDKWELYKYLKDSYENHKINYLE